MTKRQEVEPTLDVDTEFRAIEATLLETTRGRWFLVEHSRRSRRIESTELETALARLKDAFREPPAVLGRLQSELQAISSLLEVARSRLLANDVDGARSRGSGGDPSGPATAAMLKSAEELHELIWTLQTKDTDPAICEQIGAKTAAIFALSARQAQEAQRALAHAAALDAIADRVTAVLSAIVHEASSSEATGKASDKPAIRAAS